MPDAAIAADALVAAAIFAPPPDDARHPGHREPLGPGLAATRAFSFAHPLVHASVYAELGPGDRSRAHARAATLLAEAGASAERIAVHRHKCDPAGDPEAVRILRAAAAGARRRGDVEVAASHLRRALREPPPADEEPHVLRELGSAELQGGRTYDAAASLQAAVAGLTDPVERAHAAGEFGLALQMSERPEDAVIAIGAAIEALPESERELGLLLQAIRAAASQGNLAAFALARRSRWRFKSDVDDPGTPGERLFAAGIGYREATAGSAARAIELASLALPGLLRDPGPGVPAVYVAPLALFFAGALEEATDAFTAILDHAQRHGLQLGFANASHLRAGTWWRRGNLAEAEADAENAREHPSFMVRPGVLALVEIRLAQGDVAGAAAVWRDTGMDAEPMSGRASVLTRNVRARLLAAQGKPEDALADLRACGRMEDDWGVTTPSYSTWRADAVALLAELGRLDEARELADEDVPRSRAFGESRALGMSLRAAGLARASIDDLDGSVAVLRPSPARLELALSLLALGAAQRRAGRRTDARPPLAEAVELAAACGATAIAAKAHDELVAAGARPRRDPIESRSQLTASEQRVARMAADGMTNREIAQALFLTEKTIEVHLDQHLPQARHLVALAAAPSIGVNPGTVPDGANRRCPHHRHHEQEAPLPDRGSRPRTCRDLRSRRQARQRRRLQADRQGGRLHQARSRRSGRQRRRPADHHAWTCSPAPRGRREPRRVHERPRRSRDRRRPASATTSPRCPPARSWRPASSPPRRTRRRPFIQAITGGTGAYSNAHGQLTVSEADPLPATLTFDLS